MGMCRRSERGAAKNEPTDRDESRGFVTDLQKALRMHGYRRLQVDGVWGEKTDDTLDLWAVENDFFGDAMAQARRVLAQARGAEVTVEPEPARDVAFASVPEIGLHWPVPNDERAGCLPEIPFRSSTGTWHADQTRRFGASVANGRKFNAGVELRGVVRDPVVACESGEVVALEDDAVMVQSDANRQVVRYAGISVSGALRMGGGVVAGTHLGTFEDRPCWLRFAIYRPGTTRACRWYRSRPTPHQLLNPTSYLLAARAQRFPEG